MVDGLPFGIATSNGTKSFSDKLFHRSHSKAAALSKDLGLANGFHQVDGDDVPNDDQPICLSH